MVEYPVSGQFPMLKMTGLWYHKIGRIGWRDRKIWKKKKKKKMVFQRNYGWWKKKDGFGMNYGRWKNNLCETNYERFGHRTKKNDGISKELWMMKKKLWVWDELWKIKEKSLWANYGRFGQRKKMMVFQRNYGW